MCSQRRGYVHDPQELNAMLKGDTIPGMSAAPASDEAADYSRRQEDNADEE